MKKQIIELDKELSDLRSQVHNSKQLQKILTKHLQKIYIFLFQNFFTIFEFDDSDLELVMTRFNNPVPILTELLNIPIPRNLKFEGLKSKKSVHEISLIATEPRIPDSEDYISKDKQMAK